MPRIPKGWYSNVENKTCQNLAFKMRSSNHHNL